MNEQIDPHELRILTNRLMEVIQACQRMKIVADGLAMQDEQEAKRLALTVGEGILQINGATSTMLQQIKKHLPVHG